MPVPPRSNKKPAKNLPLVIYLKKDPFPMILEATKELLMIKFLMRRSLAEGNLVNTNYLQEATRFEKKIAQYWIHPKARKTIVGGYESEKEKIQLLASKQQCEEDIRAFARSLSNPKLNALLVEQYKLAVAERQQKK